MIVSDPRALVSGELSGSSSRRPKDKENKDVASRYHSNRARRGRRLASGSECAVRPGRWSDEHGVDRQLQLRATDPDSESRHYRDLDEQGRYSARHRLVEQRLQEIGGARYRRQLFVHLQHPRDLSVLLLSTPTHGGLDRRRSDNWQQLYAVMLHKKNWRKAKLSQCAPAWGEKRNAGQHDDVRLGRQHCLQHYLCALPKQKRTNNSPINDSKY